jgi:hypothetical protein
MSIKPHRYASARRRAAIRLGKPADSVRPFDSVQPGEIVDLWVAVSGSERSQNLEEVETWFRLAVENAGAQVGHVETFTGSRYVGSLPPELREAARRAKRKGRKLVAETLDRFIRVPIERHNRDVTRADLRELRSHTLRAELVTFLHPSATAKEVRAHRTMRGQWAKGNKGGGQKRNYQPRATKADLRRVKWLRECKCSWGEIALDLNRSRHTIRSWAKSKRLKQSE